MHDVHGVGFAPSTTSASASKADRVTGRDADGAGKDGTLFNLISPEAFCS